MRGKVVTPLSELQRNDLMHCFGLSDLGNVRSVGYCRRAVRC